MSLNAFVPEDWEHMTAERRRAYVSHLIGVSEMLHRLRDTAADGGEALRSVVEEVKMALAALCLDQPIGKPDEA